MSEMLISSTGNQKKFGAFLASVPWFSLFIVKLSTHLTMHCLKCLFHMDNHIDLVGTVTFVERISWGNGTSENIWKKSLAFFWILVGDFNISDLFY